MTTYYYMTQGQRFGPVSGEQLKALAAQGQLRPDDLFWREGLPTWLPAAQVKGLFPKGKPADPAPPPTALLVEGHSSKALPVATFAAAPVGSKTRALSRRALIIAGAMVGTALLVLVGVLVLTRNGKDGASGPSNGLGGVEGTGDAFKVPEILKADEQFKNLIAVVGSENGRHWHAIRCVAYSSDGKTMASGDDGHVIRLWDADTLRPQAVLAGHEGPVLALAFSADGKRLASGSADKSVRLWDLTAKPPASDLLKWHESPVAGVAFSPDGNLLASAGSDATIVLWDVGRANPKKGPTLTGLVGERQTLIFASHGKALALGADRLEKDAFDRRDRFVGAKLWNLSGAAPQELASFYARPFAFSQDGKKLGVIAAETSRERPDFVAVTSRWTDLDLLVNVKDELGPSRRGGVVAVSPDGARLAGALDNSRGRMWHLDGGPFQAEVELPDSPLAFSPDGKLLAASFGDRQLRLSDIGNDRPTEFTPFPPGDESPIGQAFSADGKVFVCYYNNAREHVHIWDLGGKEPKLRTKVPWGGYGESNFALSPDGKRLVVQGPRKKGRLEVEVELVELDADPPRAHASLSEPTRYTRVAFAADGKTLALCKGYDGTRQLTVWDVSATEARKRLSFKPNEHLVGLNLSGNGKILAAVMFGQRNIVLWNVGASEVKELGVIPGLRVAFLPDGKTLATGSGNVGDSGLVLWDVAGDRPKKLASTPDLWSPDSVLADGKTLVTSPSLWEVSRDPPRLQVRFKAGLTFRFEPAFGQTVLVRGPFSEGPKGRWSRRLYKVEGYTTSRARPPSPGHVGAVRSVAMSPDGNRVVTAGDDALVRIWRFGSEGAGEEAVITEHKGPVTAVALSPDGKTLATGSSDKSVLLWDVSGAKPKELPTFAGHGVAVRALAFAPDGKTLAIASEDTSVRLWDLTGARPAERAKLGGQFMAFDATGKMLAADATLWEVSGKTPVEKGTFSGWGATAIALSPDGRRLAVGAKSGVALHDVNVKEAGKERALEGAKAETTALAYSKDGKRLAAADAAGHVVVWNAAGKKLADWTMPGPVHALSFSADGRHLATANANGTAYVFRMPE